MYVTISYLVRFSMQKKKYTKAPEKGKSLMLLRINLSRNHQLLSNNTFFALTTFPDNINIILLQM